MSFWKHLKEEFTVIQERDPAIKTPWEVLLYPSFRVMLQYRRAHKLYKKGHYFLARLISGDNVTLYQGVTLGGTGKETGKRHPTLKDNVMVSAGAKILGSFTVGENAKIGAGAVVLQEVPPNCTVVGIPGRIVKCKDIRIPRDEMDQIHLPDPIREDIQMLQRENNALHSRLMDLENALRRMRKREKEEKDL